MMKFLNLDKSNFLYAFLIISLCAIILTGCRTENVEMKRTNYIIDGVGLNIYQIDSCQYIGTNITNFTHKGDCKNPIHKNK